MIAPPGFDDCAPRPRWLLPQAGPDCQGQGQHQVQRHERGQFIRLPFAALAEKENPGSPDGARGSLLPVEAAGIEPAPGGAKLPAESRPYLVTARNAWELISRRVPSCPALFQPIPRPPATYVQHGGGCPHPIARASWAVWLAALVAVLNVQFAPAARVPVPKLLRVGGIDSDGCEGSTGVTPERPVEVRAAWIPAPPQSRASGPYHGRYEKVRPRRSLRCTSPRVRSRAQQSLTFMTQ